MTTAAAKNLSVQRKRKMEMLELFTQDCATAEGIFIADYSGINVPELAQLRNAARSAGCQLRVVKNSVAKLALEGKEGFAELSDKLSGQLIYGSAESAQSIAKVLKDFAKENESLEIRGGVISGSFLDSAEVIRLANLPNRDQLLGIVAGTLNAPIVALARTLKEVTSSLARALGAVRDSKST